MQLKALLKNILEPLIDAPSAHSPNLVNGVFAELGKYSPEALNEWYGWGKGGNNTIPKYL